MTLRLTSTLSRQLEELRPPEQGPLLIYVCGVTPYDAAHVGHAMSYILFDTFRRYLAYAGYQVRYVQNFTDIDDKIIARANARGIPARDLAERYIADYLADMDELNVQRADLYPRATEEVPNIIAAVERLIASGHAYESNGDVYFRVRSDPEYGKLSHRSLDEMRAGARIEIDETKEDPMDFALWKAAKPGEPSWASPWGPGRPGWHIECSVMAMHHLGDQIDIHGGGHDLIFPHHENEIAQSEALTGKRPFARIWLHNGLLQLSGEKMSKSLGNLVSIREALDQYGADALRLFVLSSHYRSPLTYSEKDLESWVRGAERLRAAASAPPAPQSLGGDSGGESGIDPAPFLERFRAVMDDDFGTPQALAVLFDLVREINRARENGQAVTAAQATLREIASVLGLTLQEPRPTTQAAAPFIDLLVELRAELRRARQWALADQIRNGLAERGIALEDSAAGTSWKPIPGWGKRPSEPE